VHRGLTTLNVLVFGLVTVSMFESLHGGLIGARLFRRTWHLGQRLPLRGRTVPRKHLNEKQEGWAFGKGVDLDQGAGRLASRLRGSARLL
jgi:hypothetical protein